MSSPTTRHQAATNRGGLLVVALCFAVILLDGYDLVVYGATLPVMLQDPTLQLGVAEAGAIGSYALVGMLFGALAVGALTDRFGRRKVLLTTTVWFTVASGLCAIAPGPEVFGLLRFLCGVGLGGMLPTALALTAEYAPSHRRQLYNSIVQVGYSTGGVLASLIAIPLLPVTGWRVMYLIGALPLIVLFPLAYKLLPESPAFLIGRGQVDEARALAIRHGLDPADVLDREGPRPEGVPVGFKGQLSELFGGTYLRRSIVFALVGFCGLLLSYGVGTWLPEIMRQSGYPLGSALSFLLVLNLGNIVGSLTAARMSDRFGPRRVVPLGFLVGAACLGAMAMAPPAAVLYVLVAIVGFGAMGAQLLANAFIASSYPARIRATGLGWTVSFSRLGGIAGPLVAGLVLASGVAVAWNFWFFAAFALLAFVLLMLLGPTKTD